VRRHHLSAQAQVQLDQKEGNENRERAGNHHHANGNAIVPFS
jgi:hypothetical protein